MVHAYQARSIRLTWHWPRSVKTIACNRMTKLADTARGPRTNHDTRPRHDRRVAKRVPHTAALLTRALLRSPQPDHPHTKDRRPTLGRRAMHTLPCHGSWFLRDARSVPTVSMLLPCRRRKLHQLCKIHSRGSRAPTAGSLETSSVSFGTGSSRASDCAS